MAETIEIEAFLETDESVVIIDVRSPAEYEKGHILGAKNLPILDNEERAIIGTTFKKKGREEAILQGFALAGPKFESFMRKAIELVPERKVRVYCWRGGLRSNIASWLLQMVGMQVFLLRHGYKAYRNKVLETLQFKSPIFMVGGMTGSAKTLVLHELKNADEQILDLEYLASHKGSAFGRLGQPKQPGDEQFTNLLAGEISKLDISKPVWIENESRYIGYLKIPDVIYENMRKAPVFEIELPSEERIRYLLIEYAQFPVEDLIECTSKLAKKLGGLRLKQSIDFLKEGNFYEWMKMMISYYDENYSYSNSLRNPSLIYKLSFEKMDVNEMMQTLRVKGIEVFEESKFKI